MSEYYLYNLFHGHARLDPNDTRIIYVRIKREAG